MVVDQELVSALAAAPAVVSDSGVDTAVPADRLSVSRRMDVPAGKSLWIVVEVGNTAVGTGARVVQNTFVRVAAVVAVGGAVKVVGSDKAIAAVDFNINPGYDKPTARVTKPERGVGFALERTLGFTYPCFATLHFAEELGVGSVLVQYFTQVGVRGLRVPRASSLSTCLHTDLYP